MAQRFRYDGVGAKRGRRVEEVVEDIGYGPSQLLDNALVNGSWLADGAEALMISALTTTLAKEWDLLRTSKGALSSTVYLGTLLGSLASGLLGDAFGRRRPISACFLVIIAGSVLSACSRNFWHLLGARLLVGVGFGIGQPSAVAMLVEVSPTRWRTLNQGFAQIAFALGELFSCLALWFDDPTLTNLNWQRMLIVGAIPAGIFWVLCHRLLKESPVHLAQRNPEAARDVLSSMAAVNGMDRVNLDIAPGPVASTPSPGKALLALADSRMAARCTALGFICFVYNLTSFGVFFALPQLLPGMSVGMSAVAALTAGAAVEIPFDVVGVLVSLSVSRKAAVGGSLLGVIASLLLFSWPGGPGGPGPVATHLALLGLKGFPQITSLVLYVFVAESFPGPVRATGTAVVLGCGRLGAILSPLAYEWLAESTFHGHDLFFLVTACLTGASVLVLATLPETFLAPAAITQDPRFSEDPEKRPLLGDD